MTASIAIVGGGIAGLTAGFHLSRRYEVTLLERSSRIGGNAYTLDTPEGDAVDIAVAAFTRTGYPEFYRLLGRLGIATERSPGSYVSLMDLDTGRGFYPAPDLQGLLAQRFALLRPDHLGALARLLLGVRRSRARLGAGAFAGRSVEEALAMLPELSGMSRKLLLCVLCLLSSMEAPEILEAPAEFFFGKLSIHRDVVSPRAPWAVHCVRGGTRRYVTALAAGIGRIELDARIVTIVRDDRGPTLIMADGARRRFDEVVLACNADQALTLLAEPTERERALLGAIRYKDGRVVVHRDATAFPPRALTQAYTFLYTERGGRFETSVTGALWREPGVRDDLPYLSTQHPNFPIRDDLVLLDTVLRTPIFDRPGCQAIPELSSLNGVQHTHYCGSHFGHGLHEDAVTSALAVAARLGAA